MESRLTVKILALFGTFYLAWHFWQLIFQSVKTVISYEVKNVASVKFFGSSWP